MCWADRTTLILSFLWGSFLLLLLGSNAASGGWGWIEGMAFLWGVPTFVLWVVLHLILGRLGSVRG